MSREELEARLLDALESPCSPMTRADWAETREALVDRYSRRD